jgi:hypothetical protein
MSMSRRIPTQVGDVLILQTAKSFSVYAVGVIFENGQQEFRRQAEHVKHLSDRATAVAEAKALVTSGRRIFFRNIDTNEWSEIS